MNLRKFSPETLYRIRDQKNFYPAMRSDVTLLRSYRAYTSMTTIIVCCLDALAAGSGKATGRKFQAFVAKHLPDLCTALENAYPGRKGAETLYDGFRNGFAHLRGPKRDFVIAEDREIDGAWAEQVEIVGAGCPVALNVDRLAREFLLLLDRLEASST